MLTPRIESLMKSFRPAGENTGRGSARMACTACGCLAEGVCDGACPLPETCAFDLC